MPITRLLAFVLLAAAILTAALVPGVYKGRFQGETGGGDIKVELRGEGEAMKAEVSFTYEGREIKCNVVRLKTEGDTLDITYQFELFGLSMESAVQGELKGKELQGTYRTKSMANGDRVDSGRWQATAQP